MNLVIVESPAKVNTIQKYLGKGFIVKSSYGHVRDLPKSTMGVDTKHNFVPKYIIPPKARPHIAELKKESGKADAIYFATDKDREGEAIAWHLVQALKTDPIKIKRITFDEITKGAIRESIKHPRDINQKLVDAQQARRVLDRLVGYELSPLLWKKIRRGLSAGRVQSVAVRLIAEREEEINAFKPQEYWTISALLRKSDNRERAERVEGLNFEAKLIKHNDKTIPKLGIPSKKDAENITSNLEGATYTVSAINCKERKRTPPPPFTTSTLQQAAVNQLGFSSKRTMMIAQQLYEGIDLPEGPTGLITYMRTDSVNLAQEATAAAQKAITKNFGSSYALPSPRVFTKKAKGAQEAHEAIRPTDPARTPEKISQHLTSEQFKLYRLIWQRMIASQMAEARLQQTTADIRAEAYIFRANGMTVLFDGFIKALGEKAAIKETVLPKLSEDEIVDLRKLQPEQHFTQPPPRYSEATLVKALEEHGIGRPSTYAPIIDVIQRREYVIKGEDKRLRPTEVGTLVNGLLTSHFPNIVDIAFTAHMESDLDKIATGKKKWQPVIKAFYDPFHSQVQKKQQELNRADFTQEETDESCPKCGHPIVIKLGRFGKFKACSYFPNCKHTEPVGEEKDLQKNHTGKSCPQCGKELVVRRGKFGPFVGCTGYPKCKHIVRIEKDTGVACPKCGEGKIVEKKSRKGKTFYACNRYPDCENAYWSKPTGQKCPECNGLLVHGANSTIRCSSKECGYQQVNKE